MFLVFFISAFEGYPSDCIIDGYMNKVSYDQGETADVFINSDSVYNDKKLYLYTVNYLVVDSVTADLTPQSIINPDPWENGYGYAISFNYTIPSTLKSGMYNWGNKLFFIVKSKIKNADITIIYPSNTEEAYNDAGEKSLYDFNSTDSRRAHIVSFLRPQTKANLDAVKVLSDGFMGWTDTLSTYDIQYICDQDMDDIHEIENSQIIVVIGHSEYWTRLGRLNFDQFVNSGKNAIVLSGNTMWWQVRYNEDKTALICYKNVTIDPVSNTLLKTITWTTPSLYYPVLNSIGVDWPHGSLPRPGNCGWYGYKVMLPNSPLLAGTKLSFNDTISCRSSETDGTLFAGFNDLGDPVLDTVTLGFCKTELIGYDWGANTVNDSPSQRGYGTFIAFRKNASSGNIINSGFSNWCSNTQAPGWTGGFAGSDSEKIKRITLNMFDLLLSHSSIYASPEIAECSLSSDCAGSTKGQFSVDPNPSTGKFIVQSLEYEIQEMEAYNQFGKRVFLFTPSHSYFSTEIDLSTQPSGMYFLRINSGCRMDAFKLIVNH